MGDDYDVIVIGSGFGGSVAALRLTEKGYRVGVFEAGRRFADEELAQTSWQIRRWLWAPALGCYGIQRITLLRNVLVLSGAGVGGGSLVYAATLYEPLAAFYRDPQWRHVTDWKAELAPHYEQAKRMLGVTGYHRMTVADRLFKQVADEMGVGHTFRLTPVGIHFGAAGTDPYFGGAGPTRGTCVECGACMTGCRYNAKNSLVKNYLYLAEQNGAVVHPLSTVTAVRPIASGGYEVRVARTNAVARAHRTFRAEQVVFAAGALGTQRLLHRMRRSGNLPALSSRLGELTRTNSEAILGARSFSSDIDFTDGVAITSSFHPDEQTHIEPVRYGRGSNAMGLLQAPLTDGDTTWPRPLVGLAQLVRHPRFLRALWLRHWSERTIFALVMQSRDNSLTVGLRRSWFGRHRLTSRQGHGEPNPHWIPVGNEAVRRIARNLGGLPGSTWLEPFNIPLTAHILGGCPIGLDPTSGVIDPYHRVFGYPGLHVVDGAAVSANPGVNPALTITAQAERAMSYWPNYGEPDPRPLPGERHVRVDPVPPRRPAVPASAPAALRTST